MIYQIDEKAVNAIVNALGDVPTRWGKPLMEYLSANLVKVEEVKTEDNGDK